MSISRIPGACGIAMIFKEEISVTGFRDPVEWPPYLLTVDMIWYQRVYF
ncbi:hypothetical protein GCWU000342_00058 [Shuttleworthella satelles DSM 14600]|uniref:Uncharacterized protein n=1 Tax=Shuttleworthella satelles DSM 14600 TaxID=626523 RepID=C4G896_9FIRM|nr:hypothetical protein GCWU000342_00058 [Shuttleworthia satelles DSM 14600]